MEKILLKLTEILDIDYHSIKVKVLLWFGGILFFILLFFSVVFFYFYKKSIILSYENRFTKIANDIRVNGNLQKYKHYEIKIINKPINHDKFFIKFKDETFDVFYLLKYKNHTLQIAKFNIDNKVEDLEDTLLVSMPILMLILLFLASIMIDKILNPIKQITNQANFVNIDKFPEKIENFYKETEIKNIINAFNNMIERIQIGVLKIEQFNSDISHELKTPLSVIKAQLQFIDDKKIVTVKEEIEKLEDLINELLILTKYDKSDILTTFEKISLDSILIDVLSNFDDERIEIEKLEYIEYFGNKVLVKSAFLNIIDNALKYSEKPIKVSLYKDINIYFIVQDFGIGIAENEIDKITNRLYRVDKSRNKKGYGLGLSIVEKVINLHDAKLKIQSKLNKGTIVKIIFQV